MQVKPGHPLRGPAVPPSPPARAGPPRAGGSDSHWRGNLNLHLVHLRMRVSNWRHLIEITEFWSTTGARPIIALPNGSVLRIIARHETCSCQSGGVARSVGRCQPGRGTAGPGPELCSAGHLNPRFSPAGLGQPAEGPNLTFATGACFRQFRGV